MPTRIVDTTNTEHYLWGGDCDGWHLVKSDNLSVIEERMPPDRKEERHVHSASRQFFFVLEGELTLEVEHHDYVIPAGKGVEVHPGQAHQAKNASTADVRMMVISQPPSHGDRQPA